MKTNRTIKSKLLPVLILTALSVAAFEISPRALGQPQPSPSATETPLAQPTLAPQKQGMDQMATMDSMKRMADMCQEMMQKEKAAMPFIVGASILFGLWLFIALVLLIVLEIQWIKYWSQLLKVQKKDFTG